MSDQRYCSSCGLTIPEGQGSSCSMCYGDIAYGRDGYALAEWDAQMEAEQMRQQRERGDTMRELTDAEALVMLGNCQVDCHECSLEGICGRLEGEESLDAHHRAIIARYATLEAKNAELWETLRELWIDAEACPECCNNDSTDRAEKLLGGR